MININQCKAILHMINIHQCKAILHMMNIHQCKAILHMINIHFTMNSILLYYCLLLRELFSYSVVRCGRVVEPTARALYLTRQHYRESVLELEKTIIYLVHNITFQTKEKHTQIQHYNNNNNNKIYDVISYLHCQTWPC